LIRGTAIHIAGPADDADNGCIDIVGHASPAGSKYRRSTFSGLCQRCEVQWVDRFGEAPMEPRGDRCCQGARPRGESNALLAAGSPGQPMETAPLTRRRRPDMRPPSFRCDPFARDVAFDPGRASAPRVAVPHMLPSSE
jgi:hypothetical protein